MRLTLGQMLARLGTGLLIGTMLALILWQQARVWAPKREDFPLQGISIDSRNGSIEWGTIAAQGADFAYIRATDGVRRDPLFTRHWADARAAGLRYGAALDYDLCRPAADQATRFITTVQRDNAALPPVVRLDFRATCKARPARDAVLTELSTLMGVIEPYVGKPVLLNVSKAFDSAYAIGAGLNRKLWLSGNFLRPDYAGRKWVMWTASDMRHIDGVEGPVQWNVVAHDAE